MRALIKLRFLHSSLSCRPRRFLIRESQIDNFSSALKLSKLSRSKRNQENLKQTETGGFGALFNEITEILGADYFIPDKTPTGILISEESLAKEGDFNKESSCTPLVCRNAEEDLSQEKENMSVLEDTQLGNVREDDVSRIVGEITEIVRSNNGLVSVEERLGNLDYQLDPEIVEKVLKRCFKVPKLALRFFNWVQLEDGFCHTTGTYNTMLYIAGDAKEFGLVEKLVEEMEKNLVKKDVSTWTILISKYGKAKRISKALLVFEEMKKCGYEPDTAAYKTIIHALCTAGKPEIAMEFYREMSRKDMVIDVRLYRALVNCVAISGDIASVHSVADDVMRISLIPEHSIHSFVLKCLCISGRIKEALEMIRDLKKKEVTIGPDYLVTLVRGLCRADRISDALEIVDIMKRRHIVDQQVYGIIINGYLRINDVHKALDMFQSMKESGHLPMLSTYTELIQHLFRLNEYEESCKLYDEMLEKGVKPDSVIITAMVAALVSQNRTSEAWKFLKNKEEQGVKPTWKSYLVVIKELCKVSRTDEVVKILDEMQASNIVIQDEILNWVVTYMEKKGELDALDKVKKMRTAGKLDRQQCEKSSNHAAVKLEANMDLRINQSKPVAVDCSFMDQTFKAHSKQDLQEVCRVLSSPMEWSLMQGILEKGTVHFTPELVVEILHSCNMHGNAMLQFFSWVGKQTGYRHTTETYNMAIKIAGSAKDFKHMRNLFYEMRRKGYSITSDTWTIMILLYGRTGLTEMALNTFEEMKTSGYNPIGSTYKYLIVSLCGRKGRKVDEAAKIFHEMVRAGYIPDKDLLETYLGCMCEVGKLSDARRCTDSLHKLGYTIPLSQSLYIRALCRAGRLEEALALVDEIGTERSTLDQFICGSLVHGLLRKGQLEEALAKMDSMKKAGITLTVHVYTSLMVHYFKEKQIERVVETFQEMQQEGCEPTIVTYSALIRGYMNMGRIVDAWNIFYRMKLKGPFPDFKTYSMFITCLCKVGRSEEALHLIPEMMDCGIVPSNINFRTVFYGLNREGKQNLARSVMQQKWELIRKRKFTI
ncbi:Pentatricopeptide repeat [Quillaja saponaria]|uniref:Pentatricopeptide repeat n=1 Tax=Quillaja saponaria TaxID=32244 RepID=A0AAD7VCS1_QUISA|nr:Pentatricopeptide repeat [Quillaja saponaria]